MSELTGFPEMMDGRVKTLHPKVHGGLLAIRANEEHAGAMKAHGIKPIDLLVVSLYPFEATVAKGAGFEDCIENIDIGGPAMIRAAAKNHDDVAVIVEAARLRAADRGAEGGRHLARFRGASSRPRPMRAPLPMMRRSRTGSPHSFRTIAPDFPRLRRQARAKRLRYGENPHQTAAFYRSPRTARRRRDRATGAGQAAFLQQHQRHRRGL